MPISEAHGAYMEETRMLARDKQGRELLVGLSFEGSEWYLAYAEAGMGGPEARAERAAEKTPEEEDAERDRYLQLHDQHETARLQVLSA
jgi:hypothetical protein